MADDSGRPPFSFTFYSLRLLEATRQAAERGLKFDDLVRECLEEMLGEMGACSTIACIGLDSLTDPNIFASRIDKLFGFGGRTILNSFISYAEGKVKGPNRYVTV